jgi:phosphomannomutase / phosphoglucomutase
VEDGALADEGQDARVARARGRRVDVDEARKFKIVDDAIAHFRETHEVIDVDGARVLFGDGWGLIRASNTQPVLVTRYEARSEARLAAIRGEMEQWLRAQGVSP